MFVARMFRPATFLTCVCVLGSGIWLGSAPALASDALEQLAQAGKDSRQAAELARQLQTDPQVQLMDVLQAVKGKGAVARNWYLAIAQSIADRDPKRSAAELQQFLPRLSEDPSARYWAFTYLTRGDAERREQLLESMLADPSLELRFEAVELGLKRLEDQQDLDTKQQVARYQELLAASRLPSQIQAIAEKLKELESPVDLLQHFGFVSQWKLIGTFDNVDKRGFDVASGPEQAYAQGRLDFQATETGKSGRVNWADTITEADDGSVDLNELFDNEKGAIVYASSTFEAADAIDCELRLGSPNACKVWLNGELIMAREVYHSGNQIDQYTAPVELQAGTNTLLIKVCQNEQTEQWAQDWAFQLRFTDSSGLAIRPVK